MTSKTKRYNKLDWHYVRWGGIIAVRSVKLWALIFRKPEYYVHLSKPINTHEPTILVANHQTLLDPPAVFSALSMSDLLKISPVKFMTWHKYYNSMYKLPLYTTGCFPSHGDKLAGVDGAVFYAENRYRSFIFPEGKRTKVGENAKVYDGVVKILEKIPEARLILVYIDWEERRKLLSRPKLFIKFSDASENLDRSSARAIMDAVYKSKE